MVASLFSCFCPINLATLNTDLIGNEARKYEKISVHSLQLDIRDSGFGIGFMYSVFKVFPDLKNFQDIEKPNSTVTNTKRKIPSNQSYLAKTKP